jgi:predicted DNA-binding mobile mystery protein A
MHISIRKEMKRVMQKSASRKTPRRGPLQQRTEITSHSRAFPRMKSESVPRAGWVREIRTALGLSQSQLAARAGVSRATVQQMERAEAQRRITLASLDKLAHAMGCQVALAIMPKGGTLEDVRRSQAAAKAEVLLHEKTKDNKRPPRPADLERRKQQLITRLLRGSRRRLWKAI